MIDVTLYKLGENVYARPESIRARKIFTRQKILDLAQFLHSIPEDYLVNVVCDKKVLA